MRRSFRRRRILRRDKVRRCHALGGRQGRARRARRGYHRAQRRKLRRRESELTDGRPRRCLLRERRLRHHPRRCRLLRNPGSRGREEHRGRRRLRRGRKRRSLDARAGGGDRSPHPGLRLRPAAHPGHRGRYRHLDPGRRRRSPHRHCHDDAKTFDTGPSRTKARPARSRSTKPACFPTSARSTPRCSARLPSSSSTRRASV